MKSFYPTGNEAIARGAYEAGCLAKQQLIQGEHQVQEISRKHFVPQ